MKAPNFSLLNQANKKVTLKSFDQDFIVLYFYPKDDTPGCTTEAKEFSELLPKFKKLKATIVAISGGNQQSKAKFCEKHDLKIELLADEDFSVAKQYNAYGKKKFMGREFNGIFRNTYILDKSRKIIHTFENVKAKGHAEIVIKQLENIKSVNKK